MARHAAGWKVRALLGALVLGGCASIRFGYGFIAGAPPFTHQVKERASTGEKRVGVMKVRVADDIIWHGEAGAREAMAADLDRWYAGRDWAEALDATGLPTEGGPSLHVFSDSEADEWPHSGAPSPPGLAPVRFQYHEGTENCRKAFMSVVAWRGPDYVLIPALPLASYYPRPKGLFAKELRLRTGYTLPLKTLDAARVPIRVLNLTASWSTNAASV